MFYKLLLFTHCWFHLPWYNNTAPTASTSTQHVAWVLCLPAQLDRWGRGQETPGEDPILTSSYVLCVNCDGKALISQLDFYVYATTATRSILSPGFNPKMQAACMKPSAAASTLRRTPWTTTPTRPVYRLPAWSSTPLYHNRI